MDNSDKKVKQITKPTAEFKESEIEDQLNLDLFVEAEKNKKKSQTPQQAIPVTKDNLLGASSKLKKVDLVQVSQDKMKKQYLPDPSGWSITDGDYKDETDSQDEPVLRIRKEKKRLQIIIFVLGLAIVSVIILGIASLIAKS